jgi:peptidoglycan/LPS O-acetylase OafA/YrhL
MKQNIGLSVFRVLAIVFVFILHFKTLFSDYFDINKSFTFLFNVFHTGYFGVYMFFVLSGFLFYNKFNSNNLNYIMYLKSRALRILPAYFFIITLSYFAISNFNVVNVNFTDYLQTLFLCYYTLTEKYSPILPVSWSLEIEFLFYILVPFLVIVLKSNVRNIIILYILCHLMSYVFKDSIILFSYFKAFRFFTLGFLLAELLALDFIKLRVSQNQWMLLTFVSLCSMIYFVEKLIFDFFMALLFISVCQLSFKRSINVVHFLASRTYGIYLTHLPLLYLYFEMLEKLKLDFSFLTFPAFVLINLIASFILTLFSSNLLYKYVEKRFY